MVQASFPDPGEGLLVLARSKGAADDFVYDRCELLGESAGVYRFTPAQLASVVATPVLAAGGLSPVGGLGQTALAARCTQRALGEGNLDYFKPVSQMPGFPKALASTLSDLRAERIPVHAVGAVGQPGRDLSTLLEFFADELKSQSLTDLWALFGLATESARSRSSPLVGMSMALLDLGRLRVSERLFLAEFVAAAPTVIATVCKGDLEGLRCLENLLSVSAQDLDLENGSDSSLSRIRQQVFLSDAGTSEEVDRSFSFFSAPGEGRECAEIARRILAFASDGIAFDRMAVFLREPVVYQPQLEDVFSRAGIPGYFSSGSVRPDPAGRAMLVLLACAAEGLTASRFAEFLSLGQVPSTAPEAKPSVPWVAPGAEAQMVFKTFAVPAGDEVELDEDESETHRSPVIAGTLQTPLHWERLLVDAAVIGGLDRWERRLDGLEQELKLKSASAEEESERMFLATQLARLGHLRDFALPVIDSLGRLPAKATWGIWLEALRALAALALQRPHSVLEVLAELQPMENVGPIELAEVQEVLTDRFNFLRLEPSEQRYGKVFVGTLEEASGRQFSVVFLPGLAEGIFPKKALEDPLLLDEARVRLGSCLQTRQEKAENERLLLRLGVGVASDCLIVSYPRMDVAQGKPRVPSLYALELLRAAEGALPDLGSLERWMGEDSSSRLGWPAPEDPKQAIDTAEYDLSILDPLIAGPEIPAAGGGRYLLKVNPSLTRSLRARYKRWSNKWSDDDGLLGSVDLPTKEILDGQRLSRRSYSPTALQHYACCPYRFLLYGIYRLYPREEITSIEQMDPLIRGSLFHETQFALFSRLAEERLLPMTARNLETVLDLADEVLNEVSGRYAEDLAPAIPRVWESEVEDLRVDLRCWVRDTSRKDRDWKPLHWEFSFGLPLSDNRDPQSTIDEAVVLDGLRLRGAIDLIELDEDKGVLRVTDHKTGKAPLPKPQFVGKGEILQPLLYSLAAEVLLERPVSSAQLFYCTQRGEFKRYEIKLDQDSKDRIRQVVRTIERALEKGFLPAAPREGACTYCDYRTVCGPYEELRVARKPQGPLSELEAIRRIP